MLFVCFVIVFSAMDSHGSSPSVSGPLSDMFSASALQAMSAEEAQDKLAQQQLNIERAATEAAAAATAADNVAETSAASATVEAASVSAVLASVGLPAQHSRGKDGLGINERKHPATVSAYGTQPPT